MAQKEVFLRTKHVLDKRLCQRVRQDIEDIRLADTFVQKKHNNDVVLFWFNVSDISHICCAPSLAWQNVRFLVDYKTARTLIEKREGRFRAVSAPCSVSECIVR